MTGHTSSAAGRLARTDVTGGRRNGVPLAKPYTYNGDGTSISEAEVQARLTAIRSRLTRAQGAAPAGDAPAPELATSAAAEPPKLVVLRPVPDPETGGQASPQPEPAAEWCEGCGYKVARCACPGGPRDLAPPAPAAQPAGRCRKCGYLRTKCACQGRRRR